MDKDLEGATPKDEGAKPTPEKEVEKPTPPKAEPTPRTYTQKELDVAVGKGQASIKSQLSVSKADAAKHKADAERVKVERESLLSDYQTMQSELDEIALKQFADDPDARKAYIDRKAIADERRQVAKDRAEVKSKRYEVETLAWKAGMDRRAGELVGETGIDINEFVGCQTEEEMEVKALRFKIDNPKSEPKPEDKTPQFDSGLSSGGGMPKHPSIEQLGKMDMEQYAEWRKTRE